MKSETVILMKQIEADIEKLFGDLNKKYGYTFKWAGGSYEPDGSNLTFKINAVREGAMTTKQKKEEMTYKMFQNTFNLPPLETIMVFSNKPYVITGLNSRGTKVLATNGGKTYLIPVENVTNKWRLIQLEKASK